MFEDVVWKSSDRYMYVCICEKRGESLYDVEKCWVLVPSLFHPLLLSLEFRISILCLNLAHKAQSIFRNNPTTDPSID